MTQFLRHWARGAAAGALLCALGAALHGCVERTLVIRSEPPGAHVVLNGDPVGMTPVETPFTTYGVYDVVLSAPTCARLQTRVEVAPPWFETLPLDLFFEHVWPFTLQDRHEVTLTLAPINPSEEQGVDEREKALRDRLRALPAAAPEVRP
jgi:hypothetical protein